MRLDFNILWIDDHFENVNSYKDRLEIEVNKEGFNLKVYSTSSLEEANSYLTEMTFLDNIDLVVVDYDLGEGVPSGNIAVQEIRGKAHYKDIIFYSALETKKLRQMMLDSNNDGVFCAHRNDLSETLIGVFEALVKKTLDLDHCRGIVMGATSDIDQIIVDCILKMLPMTDSSFSDTLVDYSLEKIDKRITRFQEIREQFAKNRSIAELINSHEAFTAVDRLSLAKKMVLPIYGSTYSHISNSIGKYINEIPKERNKLGHVRLTVKGGTQILKGQNAVSITFEDIKILRQALINYRDSFDALVELVGIDSEESET